MKLNQCINLIVSCGAILLLPNVCFANDSNDPITVKIGLGKVNLKNTFDAAGLTAQGYTVNGYATNDVDENSESYGLAYDISPRLSLDINLQSFGKVNSTLDVKLPEGKTAKQAAAEIESASSQQLGGMLITLGGSYIKPVSPRFDVRIGAGLLFGKGDHQITINDEVFDIGERISAPYIKLGVGVKLTRGFTLTAHTERYFLDDDVERYEVGLSYSY